MKFTFHLSVLTQERLLTVRIMLAMKVIISHDVDHLYPSDHIFSDLIFPKLWVRSFIHFLKKKISFYVFVNRLLSVFSKRLNCIEEVMEFDRKNGVRSIFFFGMRNGLGMSYKQKMALPMIKLVTGNGFDVGVHGIAFDDFEAMKKEHDDFAYLSKIDSFGIRIHYVRFQEDTFINLNNCGYLYDSSWFNKNKLDIRGPFKIGGMWEFPLHIMDAYIDKPGNFVKGRMDTINAIRKAEDLGLPYCTVLFHDSNFNQKTYPQKKAWYEWLIRYFKKNGFEFISYKDAIEEMESRNYDGANNAVCK